LKKGKLQHRSTARFPFNYWFYCRPPTFSSIGKTLLLFTDEKIRAHFKDTNLKHIRSAYSCTQAELAKRSGVTLRSIQMYEQRNKDINKASADALYRISRVLGCSMESLPER